MNIEKLLTPERISFNLVGRSKEEAIDELIQILYQDGVINSKEDFKLAVMKREKEFSTGIGYGIGIPHGKSNAVLEPSIALGISKEGIEFDSMDGKPVNLVFLIAVPFKSDDVHLKVLSYISRKLMHSQVREKLIKAQNYNDIVQAFK
ncbi:PTS sugar transporter subunit IIA [Tepidimicrobium xylanilyticum]|uniref:PTS system D-fructose-specific IIA component (F1P-forming), Frc family n=1 Tax=Tepidimicrobium xylanilyticum TaxID=1123352 RepID=A0A1H3DQ04_9FIRM|nr:PTS sugar transporter subunit IIA [Tepidimicrobium xylanilyticum]NLW41415.1 PTS sugar transporter subunit IIA [Tissierellia bacterium]SDX68593.1 PTS system D-fructose-specific IIA component (F1P-forming), Frc family [Tepidimicrobium xylanilyticum]